MKWRANTIGAVFSNQSFEIFDGIGKGMTIGSSCRPCLGDDDFGPERKVVATDLLFVLALLVRRRYPIEWVDDDWEDTRLSIAL